MPTPFTPTTIITYGLHGRDESKFELTLECCSKSIPTISSFNILFNSFVPKNLSLETLFSIFSIISIVVSTPTSDVIRTSSKSSNTSTSTLLLPINIFPNLEKNEF